MATITAPEIDIVNSTDDVSADAIVFDPTMIYVDARSSHLDINIKNYIFIDNIDIVYSNSHFNSGIIYSISCDKINVISDNAMLHITPTFNYPASIILNEIIINQQQFIDALLATSIGIEHEIISNNDSMSVEDLIIIEEYNDNEILRINRVDHIISVSIGFFETSQKKKREERIQL